MNREIKFRLIDSITNQIIAYEEIDEKGNFYWYYKDADKEKEFGTGSFDVAYLGDGFLGKIIRNQYTGLKDKKGKDIYEGDILCDNTGNKTLVEWDEDAVGWSIGNNVSFSRMVIGNIYDNPDLLTSKTS